VNVYVVTEWTFVVGDIHMRWPRADVMSMKVPRRRALGSFTSRAVFSRFQSRGKGIGVRTQVGDCGSGKREVVHRINPFEGELGGYWAPFRKL
jgi:hypothetical protein